MKTQYIILIIVVLVIGIALYVTMLFPKSTPAATQTVETTAGGSNLLSGIAGLFGGGAISKVVGSQTA